MLLRIAEGDEEAFATLYHHYYNKLWPYFLKFTGSAFQAQEVVQEAFLRVWLSRDKLPGITNFHAWLHTVANRENLSLLRRELHIKEKSRRYSIAHASGIDHEKAQYDLEMRDLRKIVQEAISNMPEQRRRVYQLSREKGFSPAEIAEQLSISTSTVHNTLSSALADIRKHLMSAGHHFPLMVYLLLKIF